MTITSKLFDSIRISSNKKQKAEAEAQKCQWEGCEKVASHKAPAGRNHEGQYLHFCIDHVRAYNKNFNYFSGLSDKDIAKFQKDALTGHRPTWTTDFSNGTSKKQLQIMHKFALVQLPIKIVCAIPLHCLPGVIQPLASHEN